MSSSKKICDRILDWESNENPLAPLSIFQRNVILDLSDGISQANTEVTNPLENPEKEINVESPENETFKSIETSDKFLEWYSNLEAKWIHKDDAVYENYVKQLSEEYEQCTNLLLQVDSALSNLNLLSKKYKQVSNKTNSLHQVSNDLLAEQTKLMKINDDVTERLHHFKAIFQIAQRLDSPTLAVTSPTFSDLLDQIDQAIGYMKLHDKYKECAVYSARYQHCLAKAVSLLRSFVLNTFVAARQQTHAQAQACPTSDASHYARFQASTTRVKPLLAMIEQRRSVLPEYEELLVEFQQCYLDQRQQLMKPAAEQTVEELAETYRADYCSFTRSACAFLIHVSQDELRLYHQFFTQPTPLFTQYLESVCMSLYDKLRPMVVHMKHLETLAELCSILRIEMLQDHVQNNTVALEAFGSVAEQLLQDVQERLVFRAHLYLKTDIAMYRPSPGDLAYPEKLEMMEKIAQSLHEQELVALSRCESRASLISIGSSTSQEVAHLNSQRNALSSPGDLHGMWYPPLRRTLVCLSRLYRCVERPIFQGLSQEALSLCIQSISEAAETIASTKSPMDGELFKIKHLLILREQIAPFQVDFAVKEMSLDFSKMKTAAFDLLQKRGSLFSSDSLLQFLLEGSPLVREHWLDSRKDVDKNLKHSCETFINHATHFIVGPLTYFLEKVAQYQGNDLRNESWARAAQVSAIVQGVTRSIKTRLPSIQRSMQLYLANRDTEFIIYRPIKNNIVATLSKLQQLLSSGTSGFTPEDRIVIACPTPEQVTILLSSTSLVAAQKAAASEDVPTISENTEHDNSSENTRSQLDERNQNGNSESEVVSNDPTVSSNAQTEDSNRNLDESKPTENQVKTV
ncbi:conserved oligomeric Golgi complex subunit 3 [Nilaparvata lugens]|uniref:conserved oligomeric Golgi complex subunit 3 n=1 Tax=Nilaparvata lugens TaxID=108931 RepID=UPI00193CC39B|nr:conserved oligomeric Golgi complex subunit 3 [Nilaparvata lugens]